LFFRWGLCWKDQVETSKEVKITENAVDFVA